MDCRSHETRVCEMLLKFYRKAGTVGQYLCSFCGNSAIRWLCHLRAPKHHWAPNALYLRELIMVRTKYLRTF